MSGINNPTPPTTSLAATAVTPDTTAFNGKLTSSENTQQKVDDALDSSCGAGDCGDGLDALEGSPTPDLHVTSPNTVTISTLRQFKTVIVDVGATLVMASVNIPSPTNPQGVFPLIASRSVEINGTLKWDGLPGADAAGYSYGAGGIGYPAGTLPKTTGSGGNGGSMSSGGQVGTNVTQMSLGAAGGAGGSGFSSGGNGGTVTPPTVTQSRPLTRTEYLRYIWLYHDTWGPQYIRADGGAGGGGGSGGNDGAGGGGGAGGPCATIITPKLTVGATGVISCDGGKGGNGSGTNSGGGGGGGGGYLAIFAEWISNAGTIRANGGAKGNKGGSGNDGTVGSNGLVRYLTPLSG